MVAMPYRLQVFVDDALRAVLREVAHKEGISLQRFVIKCLTEKLREYPEGKDLPVPDEA